MSTMLPLDSLLLLLDDPALLAALLAGQEPELAPPVAAAAPIDPAAAPFVPMPEDAFPSIEDLDALLADSYEPAPRLDAALRAELVAAFDLDPALMDDDEALLAALAGLEPPPVEDLPDLTGEPSWDPSWSQPVREDWALG